jgi:hypothetical protein
MEARELLKDVSFDAKNYDPHNWFIEQEEFNMCAYDDEPIDIPVLVISEYTMAHYKYYISICCEKNLDDFYELLGTQPLKIVFSHLIDDEFVLRHGFNIFPETELSRKYHIHKNELYLDTNEIFLEEDEDDNGITLVEDEEEEVDENTDDENTDDENSDLELDGLEKVEL